MTEVDPDDFTGQMRLFESLDFVGLVAVALSIVGLTYKLGREVGVIKTTLSNFANRNHSDHEKISEVLDHHGNKLDNIDHRVTVVETKVDAVCDGD